MTTIGMFAEKLQEATSGELAADADRIHTTSLKVNRMVEKQRNITDFLTERSNEGAFDLARTVATVVERQRERYPDAEIRATLPESCPVETITALEQAISELVENAIVHSDRESPSVDVRVSDEEYPTVVVADDGPGIPDMDRQVLTAGKEVEPLYHGSGLGLWLVHLIVERAGGHVTVADNEPTGSAVTIRLSEQ
jgi:signal transduction histidine kinase